MSYKLVPYTGARYTSMCQLTENWLVFRKQIYGEFKCFGPSSKRPPARGGDVNATHFCAMIFLSTGA